MWYSKCDQNIDALLMQPWVFSFMSDEDELNSDLRQPSNNRSITLCFPSVLKTSGSNFQDNGSIVHLLHRAELS